MEHALRTTSHGCASCSGVPHAPAARRAACRQPALALVCLPDLLHVATHRRALPPLALSRDTRTFSTAAPLDSGALPAAGSSGQEPEQEGPGSADYAEDSEDESDAESDEEYDDNMAFVGLSEEELMEQDRLYAQDILTDEELSRDSAEHRTGEGLGLS